MGYPEDDYLSLDKTKLSVRDGFLYRYGENGDVVAKFAVEEITEVTVREKYSFTIPVLFGAGAAAIAWACFEYIQTELFRWISTICFAVVALFLLMLVKELHIVVATADGELEYHIADDDMDGRSFAIAVNRLAGSKTGA